MSQPNVQSSAAAPVFSALGNATRLELLSRLSNSKELSITSLTSELHLTRQAVTKHLRVLQQAGIVHNRKAGRENRYFVRHDAISKAQDYLVSVSHQWDQAVARLRLATENED